MQNSYINGILSLALKTCIHCKSIDIAHWIYILPGRDRPSSGYQKATSLSSGRQQGRGFLYLIRSIPPSAPCLTVESLTLFWTMPYSAKKAYWHNWAFSSEWMSNNLVLIFNDEPSTMNYYSLFILQKHLEVLTDDKAFHTWSSQDISLLLKVFNLYKQDKGEKMQLSTFQR